MKNIFVAFFVFVLPLSYASANSFSWKCRTKNRSYLKEAGFQVKYFTIHFGSSAGGDLKVSTFSRGSFKRKEFHRSYLPNQVDFDTNAKGVTIAATDKSENPEFSFVIDSYHDKKSRGKIDFLGTRYRVSCKFQI